VNYDFAIIGGGIVGLSSALAVTRRFPDARILVLEKESRWAFHQSGHNSGVIHSGIYYKPGSYKARFARASYTSLTGFCREHGIVFEMCGKLVVARDVREMARLGESLECGLANGLNVRRVGPEEISEIEPHVLVPGALHVPEAGIVSYGQVCGKFAEIVAASGGDLRLNTKAEAIRRQSSGLVIQTNVGDFETRFLITCAGLQEDRVAEMDGAGKDARMIPFRGDYYALRKERRHLVRNLVYPVPNPIYPFLGVHLVRRIGGEVHIGPNAALNLSREGYGCEFNLKEFAETVSFPGFRKLAWKYWEEGLQEMWRSLRKKAFVKAAQRFVPEMQSEDLEPAPSGIRAQMMTKDGSLIDDFLFVDGPRSVHVLNAPSPAATCSIEIGKAVAERVAQRVQGG
jgi:(S)-2-hydroxyglutarate dehydrogenase